MHFHLPKPLHGWRQFIGEVGIIVLGVLIALGAEQLVESWNTHLRVEEGHEKIKTELGHAYEVAEERYDVRPCIDEQLAKIEDAVLSSGSTLTPLPLYSEGRGPSVALVLRSPYARILPESDLQTFIAAGFSTHLSARERTWLPALYTLMSRANGLNLDELAASGDLTALSKPLPLDPQVKSGFVREIEQERIRNDSLARLSLTLTQWISETGYVPSSSARGRWLEHSPTIQFCKSHGFTVTELSAH
jgi:hypothetical protein